VTSPTQQSASRSVVVVGSVNMDLVARSTTLPRAGETLLGHDFRTTPGGKGANQAVAASRAGAATSFVGCVGRDAFGAELLTHLRHEKIALDRVRRSDLPTGVAIITVDDAGQNTIVVVAGANGATVPVAVSEREVGCLQLEVPLDVVVATVTGSVGTIVLDPAPARELPDEVFAPHVIVTPNETEAAAITGIAVDDEASVRQAADALLSRGAGAVVMKLGARGLYWSNGATGGFVAPHQVDVVDTVAAGDACNGAIAAALAAGKPLELAVLDGNAAGALATTKAGAQAAMPTAIEIETLVRRARSR
jgi:ribokinase